MDVGHKRCLSKAGASELLDTRGEGAPKLTHLVQGKSLQRVFKITIYLTQQFSLLFNIDL